MKIKEYRSSRFKFETDHSASVYYWQRFSTIVSFFIFTSLICAGVFFAYIEFDKGKGGENKFKVSADGLEISSKIIGLIILSMSLIFAYIYIDRIYPINDPSRGDGVEAIDVVKDK